MTNDDDSFVLIMIAVVLIIMAAILTVEIWAFCKLHDWLDIGLAKLPFVILCLIVANVVFGGCGASSRD